MTLAFTLTIDAAALATALRIASWALYVLAALIYALTVRVVWRMGCEPPRDTVPLWLRVLVSVFWPIACIAGLLIGWRQKRRARKAAL